MDGLAEDEIKDLSQLFHSIQSERYLERGNRLIAAPPRFGWMLHQLEDQAFLAELRMPRSSFHQLIDSVYDHPAFRSLNPELLQQVPAWTQVAVTLKRFGCQGTSIGALARTFSIGGTLFDTFECHKIQ